MGTGMIPVVHSYACTHVSCNHALAHVLTHPHTGRCHGSWDDPRRICRALLEDQVFLLTIAPGQLAVHF
eukprot:1143871-Pelagomonas_calceolata.AAC.1